MKRETLRLKTDALVEPENEQVIELAPFDVLLPCRKFKVEHKVSVLGKVSLTSEFLLRLVKVIPGISENDVAVFFGFDRREMSFVLAETETPGYLDRREGRLWLSESGASLFRDASGEPAIFSVERRSEDYGFDLISLAPQKPLSLDMFELCLPELEIADMEKAGSAALGVRNSFRKFYSELGTRGETSKGEKKDLYSIDNIVALDRFRSVLPFVLKAQSSTPSKVEVDLSVWRPMHEQEDRTEVIGAITNFVDKLRISRRDDDAESYSFLLKVGPEFLKEYERRDGLSVERYYREALSRTGDFQSNRPTITALGSVLLNRNREKLAGGLAYGSANPDKIPSRLIWLAPQVINWGATNHLGSMTTVVKRHLNQKFNVDLESIKSMCLISGQSHHYLDKAFDFVCQCQSPVFPRGVEILLIPNIAVVLLVHAPIGSPNGFPVPLGLMSYDRNVLKRVQDYMKEKISYYVSDNNLLNLSLEDLNTAPADIT